ncbi:MAG: hypothetical protein U0744_01175 [Gemmataceae bacterium]
MNPLQARLRSLRLRYWAYSMLAGLLAIGAIGVGSAAVVGLLDFQVQLPSLLRAFALVGTLGGSGYLVWRFMVQPLGARSDDLSLALKVEAIYPELNDILASTVQFLEQEDRLPPGDSALLRKKAIEKALDASADLDFYRMLDKRPLGYAALGVMAAVVAFFFMRHRLDEHTPRALARYLDPFGRHTWTDIEPDAGLRKVIAVGQPFVFKAKVLGVLPPQSKIEVEGFENDRWQRRPDLVIPLKADRMLVRGLDVTSQKSKFRLRVTANDGSYPRFSGEWHPVDVMPPPSSRRWMVSLRRRSNWRFPSTPTFDRRSSCRQECATSKHCKARSSPTELRWIGRWRRRQSCCARRMRVSLWDSSWDRSDTRSH